MNSKVRNARENMMSLPCQKTARFVWGRWKFCHRFNEITVFVGGKAAQKQMSIGMKNGLQSIPTKCFQGRSAVPCPDISIFDQSIMLSIPGIG
jgi:hypothetical protein